AKITMRAVNNRAVAENVAAGSPTLGVLLPYTPIHHLLLGDMGRPLVMTSGNRRDEPMAYEECAALRELGDVADFFVTHDRRIEVRCDDSVVRVAAQQVSPVRRGRGHAPTPLVLAENASTEVLAVGGHLKNTFCVVSGAHAYVSQHVGNLESVASYEALEDAVSQMCDLLHLAPQVIAHDRHPDYLSTRFAMEFPAARRVPVQHHHAHVLSCMAEHRCTEPVIGVAFDGAGLGTDGAIWGGEFLVVEGVECRRAAHLAYVPLPGGDVAAREPWRMAVAHLTAAYGKGLGPLSEALATRLTPSRFDVVRQMVARGICSAPTSSMGRLFDAVAALIGLRDTSEFEGQAAMELEAIAGASAPRRYRFELDTTSAVWTIDAAPVIRDLAADVVAGHPRAELAAMFHEAVGAMITSVAARIARQTGIDRVALTGGVFQNALLSQYAVHALVAANLEVLQHRRVPCNDGGLSLGQALLALRMVSANSLQEGHSACA
ncbi:MAG: Sua5/YciO/YrdC/YwlC family protein, partial [Acidobacteria bacterium]|nr:Sua5/YciO/YrdC/YwlC family protein [Acidobacteriota bacterium]